MADSGNQRIRKITPDGVVSTLAGSGTKGFKDGSGLAAQFYNPNDVAVDDNGNIFVADGFNSSIRKITPDGTVSTLAGNGEVGLVNKPGTDARFKGPAGITVGKGGMIYVADQGNHRIRQITPDGIVSTLVGKDFGFADGNKETAQFYSLNGITFDKAHNALYVSDNNSNSNNHIRKIQLLD